MQRATFIPSLAEYAQVVTVAKSGARFSSPATAAASITDASETKRYLIDLCPGIYDVGDAGSSSGFGLPNWVDIRGRDRAGCVIRRTASPGTLSPVIQLVAHHNLSNFTIDSSVSRHLHWDTQDTCTLHCDGVTFYSATGQDALSAGASGGSRLLMTNSIFDKTGCGVHSGGAGNGGLMEMIYLGCLFTAQQVYGIGVSLDGSPHDTRLVIQGTNFLRYFGVDPTSVSVVMPSAPRKLFIVTDLAATDFIYTPAVTGDDVFWNCFELPNTRKYRISSDGADGNLVVYDFATDRLTRDFAANAAFPGVLAQGINTPLSPWPRVITGPYASVKIVTAQAVALGDVIVTSATAGEGTVNNAQTDLTKVLGWAISTKAGATAGRVNVKLNPIARSW